jgi:cyclohexanecarboxylate-CoA ligase
MDANGSIRISSHSKDVIIRGGEKMPVVEIESLLYKHPAVAQVAVVAYPDGASGRARLRCDRHEARATRSTSPR